MLSNRAKNQRFLTSMFARYSSGHHFKRKEFIAKSKGVKYEIAVDKEDFRQEYGNQNSIFEDRLFRKLAHYFRTHRDHVVDNIRPNKYSAYYWLPRLKFFRSRSFLSLLSWLFEKSSTKKLKCL